MKIMLQKLTARQEVPNRETGIVVGIDVSKGKLDFAAYRQEGRTAVSQVPQNAVGLRKLKKFIEGLHESGYQVWVAFEPTGPYSISLREWLIVNRYRAVQVNPFHTYLTKEVRDNSPLKTDRKDPGVIADLVFQGCYQEVHSSGGVFAELRSAILDWRSCDKTRTALGNEFQGLLDIWFPELADLFGNLLSKTVLTLVKSYPTARAIGRAPQAEIRSLIKQASRGKVNMARADKIWRTAGESIAWEEGYDMRHQHMCRLITQLEALEAHRKDLQRQMAGLLAQLPQAEFLLSAPRVGIITVASLFGMCGDLQRYESCQQLEKFMGLNLYEVSSGKHKGKHHISKRGNAIARSAMYLAALGQMREGGLYYEYAKRQKEKRQPGTKIQIAVARKLLSLLFTLAHKGIKFEERRFFRELKAGDEHCALKGMQLMAA